VSTSQEQKPEHVDQLVELSRKAREELRAKLEENALAEAVRKAIKGNGDG